METAGYSQESYPLFEFIKKKNIDEFKKYYSNEIHLDINLDEEKGGSILHSLSKRGLNEFIYHVLQQQNQNSLSSEINKQSMSIQLLLL
jgi:hypothetical protein